MSVAKISVLVVVGLILQGITTTDAKPDDCGCGPYGGDLTGGFIGGCSVPVTPPISFAPVPQPLPIKIPSAPQPSVTIPNMIIALLPPTNKPPVKPCPQPTPAPAPQPLVLPIPQPYPVTVPDCGC